MIILNLQMHGYDAYAVGGCVRDSILAKKPQDWDITTSAKPADIKRMFRRTVDTGIEHGTVTVLLGKDSFEVTTYRIDGVYEDNRHPKEVRFTNNLEEDLKRRDFTINAMAISVNAESFGELLDPFNGIIDLHNKIIRTPLDPDVTFSDDPLRMMRAVRFATQLDFKIHPDTLASISRNAARLRIITRERINTELMKIMASAKPSSKILT